jgi:DNA-binding GntR family transcriptional regulator
VAASEGNTEFAYAQIREAIVEGRYAPACRLKEQRVAEELNLSRTPVREALKMLAAEGLVQIERNVGAMVRPIDRKTIVDLYELRGRLESYAAARAATHGDVEQLARLRSAISQFALAIEPASLDDVDGIRRVNEWNGVIHSTIVEAADHDRLASMLARAVDVPLVFQAFRQFDRAELERSNLFHELIVDAIEASDPGRAERLMAEHIDEGRDVLLAAVDQRLSVEDLFSASAS